MSVQALSADSAIISSAVSDRRIAVDAKALRAELINDTAALPALAEAWNAISCDMPFRRHEWLATWWRHYQQSGDELFLIAVRDAAGQLHGLAPLYRTVSLRRGKLLRMLGTGKVASDHLTILANPGNEQAVGLCVGQWLMGAGGRLWDRMALDGIDPGDAAMDAMCSVLSTHRVTVETCSGVNCWRMPLPGDWDRFLAQLSKSRRNRVRRLFRELLDSGRGELHVARTIDDVRRGFEILVSLHQRRRNSLGDGGCFESAQFVAFHTAVMEQFLQIGRLRLCWLTLDGVPASIEYQLLGQDTAFFYQSGLNPDLEAQRPGWLTKGASIRMAIDDGLHTFDFLRGDEPYKASWSATPLPVLEYHIARPQLAAHIRHNVWRLKHAAKKWLKSRLRGRPTGDQSEQQTTTTDEAAS